ncbi:hypothetical protein LJC43_08080 [Parabacteroides sp. OttesenSCG-928-G21]|jgi:hypothetical protein|nr:hypothetical protein [Parabacteroides sp. OttesenSCG-928-G21]
MIKTIFKKYGLTLTGLIIGALGGYLYWLFIGCTTGSCPITSSPLYTSIWGAIIGGLIFNSFETDKTDYNK